MREAERRQLRLAAVAVGHALGRPQPARGAASSPPSYDRARVGLVLDPARLSVLRRLGLAISSERLASLRLAAALVIENEAVGIEAGYLPGLGERDDNLAARDGVRGRHAVGAARPPRLDRRRSRAAAASPIRSGSR